MTGMLKCFSSLSLSLSVSLSYVEFGAVSRFLELSALLDSGRPPKVDKSAILADALKVVNQLRDEARKLKDSNESLQDKINELKVSLIFSFLLFF